MKLLLIITATLFEDIFNHYLHKNIKNDNTIKRPVIVRQSEKQGPILTINHINGTGNLDHGQVIYDDKTREHYFLVYNHRGAKKDVSFLYMLVGFGESYMPYGFVSDNKSAIISFIGVKNGFLICNDRHNKTLYYRAYGAQHFTSHTFTHEINTFKFHPSIRGHVAAYDIMENLYITIDMGLTWNVVGESVSNYTWSNYNHEFYFTSKVEGNKDINILMKVKLPSLELEKQLDNVVEIGMLDNLTYAIVKFNKILKLYILDRKHIFKHTIFPLYVSPKKIVMQHYYNNVIVVIIYNDTNNYAAYSGLHSHLKFVKIVHNLGHSSTLNSDCINMKMFSRIDGLMLTNFPEDDNYKFSRSFISFNHGFKWSHIVPSRLLTDITCIWPDCHLKLDLGCDSRLDDTIVTVEKAPNIMVATGKVYVKNIYERGAQFISADAGLSWSLGNAGHSLCTILDHGGVIVSSSNFHGQFSYSFDMGISWKQSESIEDYRSIYIHHDSTGVSTTALFIGYDTQSNDWKFVKANFSKLISGKCRVEDYDLYTPGDVDKKSCYHGKKNIFYKRKHKVTCLSILNELEKPTPIDCACTKNDFGCNFGYTMIHGECSVDPDHDKLQYIDFCKPGKFQISDEAMVKLPNNECTYESDKLLEPHAEICGLAYTSETITVRTKSEILYYSINNMEAFFHFPLKITNISSILSYDVDFLGRCLFYSNDEDIKMQCWRVKSEIDSPHTHVLWMETGVFRLKFDTLGRNLFFATNNAISILKIKQKIKKTVITDKNIKYFNYMEDQRYIFYSKSDPTQAVFYDLVTNRKYFFEVTEIIKIIYYIDTNNTYVGLSDNYHHIFLVDLNIYQQQKATNHQIVDMFYHHNKLIKFTSNEYFIESDRNGTIDNILETKINTIFHRDIKNCQYSPCKYICIEYNKNYKCICPDNMEKLNNVDCRCSPHAQDCEHCKGFQFKCDSGNCIDMNNRCDGIAQCHDLSDEKNCKLCNHDEIQCPNNSKCISVMKLCDGFYDCTDKSDEFSCEDQNKCFYSNRFKCESGRCIDRNKLCDTNDDCDDFSDEKFCLSINEEENLFQCDDNVFISISRRCDGIFDCENWSDEFQCFVTFEDKNPKCVIDCDNHCIENKLMCNHRTECSNGEDEINCKHTLTCPNPTDIMCITTSACYKPIQKCDDFRDCSDGSDETDCHKVSRNKCTIPRNFKCKDYKKCIDIDEYCDGVKDCHDGSDEVEECKKEPRIENLRIMEISETNVKFQWDIDNPSNIFFYEISLYNHASQTSTDYIHSIQSVHFEINKLSPCTQYEIFIKVSKQYGGRSLEFVTRPEIPTAPDNVTYIEAEFKLSWHHNKEWCLPAIFYVHCQTASKIIEKFTKDTFIHLSSKIKDCKIATCPMDAFNISCSQFSFYHTYEKKFSTLIKIGLSFIGIFFIGLLVYTLKKIHIFDILKISKRSRLIKYGTFRMNKRIDPDMQQLLYEEEEQF